MLGSPAFAQQTAPADQPYNLDKYDPLWAAARAHAMPVSFHVGTGSNPVTERGPGGAVINYVEVGLGAQRTLTYLAASGVLHRFPALHVVMVECGAGWLAWALERMDEAYEEHVYTIVGGAGIPLYLAGLLLIPEEGSDRSIAGSLIESLRSRSR